MTGSEQLWAIVGTHGLYVGTWRTRAQAIAAHVHDVRGRLDPLVSQTPEFGTALSSDQLAIWRRCRKSGDRAVKVTITWDEPNA